MQKGSDYPLFAGQASAHGERRKAARSAALAELTASDCSWYAAVAPSPDSSARPWPNQLARPVMACKAIALSLSPGLRSAARSPVGCAGPETLQLLCRWEVGTPANMVLVESAADFEHGLRKALSTYSLVVVDYFAPWCHACRSLYPKLRQIAAQHDDVMFLKVRHRTISLACHHLDTGLRPRAQSENAVHIRTVLEQHHALIDMLRTSK